MTKVVSRTILLLMLSLISTTIPARWRPSVDSATGSTTTYALDFFYDSNGYPYALKYNNTLYYYITNLQGDVMQIVDANGNPVATYSYDPYGTVLTATGTPAEINPLRYRGYYYDTETGLYYVSSRYYDPEIGRFINADAFASTGQGIIGNNMFAYCNNNPICYVDPLGHGLVGLGAQFDVSTGGYECGIEIIVYWDEDVCEDGGLVVAVYTYEGMSVNLDEVLINPDVLNIVTQLTLALTANVGQDYDTLALIELQSLLFGTNVSGSVVGIWGYEGKFDSTDDYAGPFTSYSANYKNFKITWSYCDFCWSLAVGGTTDLKSHISFGQTNYVEIYSSLQERKEYGTK